MFFARTVVLAIAALTLSCGGLIAGGPYRPFQVGLWSGGVLLATSSAARKSTNR